MTDTEKAREIGEQIDDNHTYEHILQEDVERACLEMAAWKEEQMISWLQKNAARYVVCDESEFSHYATKTMLEDFKKVMMED